MKATQCTDVDMYRTFFPRGQKMKEFNIQHGILNAEYRGFTSLLDIGYSMFIILF